MALSIAQLAEVVYWRLKTQRASRVTPCAVSRDSSRCGVLQQQETLSEWKRHGWYVKVGLSEMILPSCTPVTALKMIHYALT